MAQVYGKAHLTLVAARPASSIEGFMKTHSNLDGITDVPLPYSHRLDTIAGGVVYAIFQPKTKDSPVEDRAWCFRERILSTRMVVFGAGQLAFNCQEHVVSESGYHTPTKANGENVILRRILGADDTTHRYMVLSRYYKLGE